MLGQTQNNKAAGIFMSIYEKEKGVDALGRWVYLIFHASIWIQIQIYRHALSCIEYRV